jgi:dipeptidyl aminopeptidase/acylaminoacyl peptidase
MSANRLARLLAC